MVKHFCDICGREITDSDASKYTLDLSYNTDFACDRNNSDVRLYRNEVCQCCAANIYELVKSLEK